MTCYIQCCLNVAFPCGNKNGNIITNNPSVVYSLMGDVEMFGHCMLGLGHPSPNCSKDLTSSISLHVLGRSGTNELLCMISSIGSSVVGSLSIVKL